jgi:hypothetical protein
MTVISTAPKDSAQCLVLHELFEVMVALSVTCNYLVCVL